MTALPSQHESQSGDAAWSERLLAVLTSCQQRFDPAADPADAFGVLLDGYMTLTGAAVGLIAEIVSCENGASPQIVMRAVATSGSASALTVGDPALGVVEALLHLAARTGHPCARARDEQGLAALAVPIASGDKRFAVAGFCGSAATMTVHTGTALAPYSVCCARSISEIRALRRHAQAEQRLIDSERRMRAVLDNIVDAIVTVDSRGRVETINAAAEHVFGYTPEELVGMPFANVIGEPVGGEGYGRFAADADGPGRGRETRGLRKDGSAFPMDLAMSPIDLGSRELLVAVARDMSEHRENQRLVERERAANRTLELLIRVDGLTGISNRRHFDEVLTDEARRAARDAHPLSVIMCDIDCFKAFNDRYGHVAGDKALIAVARGIDATFQRAGDTAARYGGEEFAVILPNTSRGKALKLAETLRQRVEALSIPHGASTVSDRVSISAGIATCRPGRQFDVQDLVDAADQALYQAKNAGRNRVRG